MTAITPTVHYQFASERFVAFLEAQAGKRPQGATIAVKTVAPKGASFYLPFAAFDELIDFLQDVRRVEAIG